MVQTSTWSDQFTLGLTIGVKIFHRQNEFQRRPILRFSFRGREHIYIYIFQVGSGLGR